MDNEGFEWITYKARIDGRRSLAHLVSCRINDNVMTQCGVTIYPWWEPRADKGLNRCGVCGAALVQLRVFANESQ